MSTGTWARAILILLCLALGVALSLLVSNLLPLVHQGRGETTIAAGARAALPTSTTSLVEAGDLADGRARRWRDDVVLVRVEGSWIVPQHWRSVVDPPVAWSFTYYSPGADELVSVPVSDGQVRWVPPRPIPIVPAALTAFPPAFGVDAVWPSLLAAGVEQLIEGNPGTQVDFLLQPRSGEPTWTASARNGDALVRITMHAQTGVVSTQ